MEWYHLKFINHQSVVAVLYFFRKKKTNKTKQNKTKQNKTKQNKTKQKNKNKQTNKQTNKNKRKEKKMYSFLDTTCILTNLHWLPAWYRIQYKARKGFNNIAHS